MKMTTIMAATLLFTIAVFGQNKRSSYTQFNLSIPLRGNPDRGDDSSEYWFLPDGVSAKFGGGFHYNKHIEMGINTGLDWLATEKLVVAPVFANFRLGTRLGSEALLYLQTGYGKSIILGRGNLMGDYKKISLGIEDYDGISLFAEIAQYKFSFKNTDEVWSISIGISWTTFKNRDVVPK
jgi:hypothetical protein